MIIIVSYTYVIESFDRLLLVICINYFHHYSVVCCTCAVHHVFNYFLILFHVLYTIRHYDFYSVFVISEYKSSSFFYSVLTILEFFMFCSYQSNILYITSDRYMINSM